MVQHSLSSGFFDDMYRENDDPWHFATSSYEHEKYTATIAALSGATFRRGLEIGCSVGVLTQMLAPFVESIEALDINARAIELASRRCRDLPQVHFTRGAFPSDVPQGSFDYVLVSEVGYYWSDADLALAKDRIVASASGGLLELVHYLPKVAEYPRSGDSVHEAFLSDTRYVHQYHHRAELYRIDTFLIS